MFYANTGKILRMSFMFPNLTLYLLCLEKIWEMMIIKCSSFLNPTWKQTLYWGEMQGHLGSDTKLEEWVETHKEKCFVTWKLAFNLAGQYILNICWVLSDYVIHCFCQGFSVSVLLKFGQDSPLLYEDVLWIVGCCVTSLSSTY